MSTGQIHSKDRGFPTNPSTVTKKRKRKLTSQLGETGAGLRELVQRLAVSQVHERVQLSIARCEVRISSFSIALAGSSFATTAADSVGAVEPATEGAFEDGAVGGRFGLAMFGALPVPWTGGMFDGGNASRNTVG
jgi:hypothetical protein